MGIAAEGKECCLGPHLPQTSDAPAHQCCQCAQLFLCVLGILCILLLKVSTFISAHSPITGNAGKDYKAKYRSLHYNLKDTANPELRARVLTGELVPGALVRLSNQDLASRVRLMRCEGKCCRELMLACAP